MRRSLWLSIAFLAGCSPTTGDRCVTGMTIECPCAGGGHGIQTCQSDGTFEACRCDTTDAGTGVDAPPAVDAPVLADVPETIDAPVDAPPDAPADAPPPHVYYVDHTTEVGPVWANLPTAGGMTGLEAGNAACRVLGADHVCDYEEVLLADAADEPAFRAIADGTTAWIHRTTTAVVGGVDSPPGPGGRCNAWNYNTNHIADGEYATFDATGPTFLLDNDTVFDAANPGVHTLADLPCGGAMRVVLCCSALP